MLPCCCCLFMWPDSLGMNDSSCICDIYEHSHDRQNRVRSSMDSWAGEGG
jgi:hypothetical protein